MGMSSAEKTRAHRARRRQENEAGYLQTERAKMTAWRSKSKPKIRNQQLKCLYGITLEQYQEMLAAQNGRCLLCQVHQNDAPRVFDVDHDHETGEVRGILCSPCNRGIGLLKECPDTLQRAITYLSKRGA